MVFIPKGGGKPTDDPKAYRPISLSSSLLKTMEKLLDLHIRDKLTEPLHVNQFAYQSGKSTEDAFHNLVTKIEGAFDNTSYSSIVRACKRKGLKESNARWICSMLSSRIITAGARDSSVVITTNRGCPQGGVLSPILWKIVVDSLLYNLSNAGFEVQGYADDLAIMVRGKFDSTIRDRMMIAMDTVFGWCQEHGLSVNPSKTVLVPFTRKRKPYKDPFRSQKS